MLTRLKITCKYTFPKFFRLSMSRRSLSLTPDDSREAKRPRLEALTPDDYRNGLILAPMVRSGALPTRLFALKHGAKLVWGPEMVDKAMLHAERIVDPKTGVISYNGKSKAMFTTHPIEKPYLIFQLGSSSPELAIQAAKIIQDDVAGIDLNCGCPKPFSTHSGMGAALLSNPDLLCAILAALRAALPPRVSLSAKIRLLPDRAETLRLVERIVATGVSCITVHCRTRNMRQREPALIHRLREVVEFVRGLGRDVAVVQNGDCVGYEDGRRIRAITTADSCMIATAAESNPTIFSPTPLTDLEKTFIPSYVRLCKYFNNHPSSTKFCVAQFKGAHTTLVKAHRKAVHDAIVKGKGYADWEGIMAEGFDAQEGLEMGEKEFRDIVAAIEARAANGPPVLLPAEGVSAEEVPEETVGVEGESGSDEQENSEERENPAFLTPPDARPLPSPEAVFGAPLGPANERMRPVPALVAGRDDGTPTPMGRSQKGPLSVQVA